MPSRMYFICLRGRIGTFEHYRDADRLEKLPIPINLDSALRRSRRKGISRLLWADSICIDQNNIGKRDDQVKLMSQLYMHAETVLIWSGEESAPGQIKAAFQCTELLA